MAPSRRFVRALALLLILLPVVAAGLVGSGCTGGGSVVVDEPTTEPTPRRI